MNKIISIIFVLVSLSLFSQSNFGKITYEVSLVKNKINLEGIDKSVRNELSDFYKNAKPVKAILLYNNSKSLYFVEKKLKSDNEQGLNLVKIFAGSDGHNFTDLSKNINIRQTDATGSMLRIALEKNEWIIKKDSKIIDNYKCFKAISKNNPKTIAWYAPSIPVNHGPKSYNGLPGLILELQLNKYYWIVRKIEFNYPDAKEIMEPKEGKLITQEQYREYSKNIFGKN